jgi:hypothetical protein
MSARKLGIGLLLCGSEAVAGILGRPILPRDPIFEAAAPEPGARRATLKLRLITHGSLGSAVEKERLLRQLLAAERILSQCKGLEVKLQVTEQPKAPLGVRPDGSADHDALTTVAGGELAVTPSFLAFFGPWRASRGPNAVDVHLVDYLGTRARQEDQQGKPISQQSLGQAFNAAILDNLYRDPRPAGAEPLSAVAGHSVVLAMRTLLRSEGKVLKFPDPVTHQIRAAYAEYHSSLLAHELGHILLEAQDGKGSYVDHYCPGARDACPDDNLMTGGGYADFRALRAPSFKKVELYSPLAPLEPEQCELLARHPLLE